jgi:hypothetical protein
MSCSERKIEANRRNAQKSTGPKTVEGKARASRNALKHGLCAESPQVAVVLEEDPAAYEAFAREMLEDLRPVGAVQRALADRIVFVAWKLQRIPQVEARFFVSTEGTVQHPRRDERGMRTPATVAETIAEHGCQAYFGRLQMYEMRLERSFHAGLRQLERSKKMRNEANEDEENAVEEKETEVPQGRNEPNEATAAVEVESSDRDTDVPSVRGAQDDQDLSLSLEVSPKAASKLAG